MSIYDQLKEKGYNVVLNVLWLKIMDNGFNDRQMGFVIEPHGDKICWRVLLDEKPHYVDNIDQLLVDIETWIIAAFKRWWPKNDEYWVFEVIEQYDTREEALAADLDYQEWGQLEDEYYNNYYEDDELPY